ncbi:MAG: DUF2795 domain-containing protein [Thermoleophilaceae bacterium]|jgi:Protein of unknown function (DUF2795)
MEASDRWQDDVRFPAGKLELIDAAADGGAPQEVVERLQRLSRERYESADELEAELGGQGV